MRRKLVPVVTATVLSSLAMAANPAQAAETATATATADTTYTQVVQDGDNAIKTTLATCPRLCDGNPNGERNAVLGFSLTGLPADATVLDARLELSTWTAVAAQTTVHLASGGAGPAGPGTWSDRPTLGPVLDTNDGVSAGYNSWDVTSAVHGNGTFTSRCVS